MGTFTLTLKRAVELDPTIMTDSLGQYPIFDETYREGLNQKLYDHFCNQEIGQETIPMFKLALRRKMNEIMPLYNQHYRLSLLEVDPLSTMSIKSIVESDSNTESETAGTNESDSAAKSRAVASDTPQTQLNSTQDYATQMQDNVSESKATGEATEKQTAAAKQNQTSLQDGYAGHAPLLILQARQALVNVDVMVIGELKELFMLIWANNDSYTQNYLGRLYPYGYRF